MSIEYCAGLFDGEGCISISGSGQLSILVQMTDLIPLLEMTIAFTGSTISNNVRPLPSGRNVYTWRLTDNRAMDALGSILPYLRGEKAYQASLVLQRFPRPPRGSGHKGSLTKEVRILRMEVRELLMASRKPVGGVE